MAKACAYSCQHRLWHAGVGEFGENNRHVFRAATGQISTFVRLLRFISKVTYSM